MADVHNRMPVILNRSEFDAWLDPAQHNPAILSSLLNPAPGGTLLKHPIGTAVNSPRNDGPQLIEPVPSPATGAAGR